MSVCRDALDSATIEDSRHVFAFKLECKNAVGAVIGFPTRAHIRKAEAALASKPSKKREQDLRIALRKYDAHKKLFDKLVNYINESAAEVNFDRTIVDPRKAAENWRAIFSKRGYGEITPLTTQQGAYTVSGLSSLVDRIIKKRNKNLKRGKLSRLEIMLAPPDIIMSHVDFSGSALKLVNKALRIGDKDISMVNKFNKHFDRIRSDFALKWEQVITSSNNVVFNLNNASMDGVKGFVDTDGNDVTIVGEGIFNGVSSYKIKNAEGEIEWLAKDDLQATDEEVREGLLSLYTDNLPNEMLDGQVRKIIPKLLNWDIDEEGFLVSEETGKALQYIKKKLDLMRKEGLREDGDRVAGIHEKRVSVPYGKKGKTREYVYRYVMIKQGESSIGEEYHAYLIDRHEVDTKGGGKINGVRFIGLNKQYNFLGEEMPSEKTSYTQEDLNNVFEGGGYFKSEEINDFGRLIDKNDKPIKHTHTKQYINFNKMENPPNEAIMDDVNSSIHEMRELFSRIWVDMKNRTIKLDEKRARVQAKIEKKLKKENPDITDSEIKEYFDEIYSIGGVDSRIWWDSETQTLRTANSWAKKKEQNYVPHLYDRQNIIFKQLPKQIADIEIKLGRAKRTLRGNKTKENEERVEQYKLGLAHLTELMSSMDDNSNSNKLVDLQTNSSLKHITAWTNQTERRKDGDIYKEYLEGLYRSHHRNEVIVELLDTVHTMQRMGEHNVEGITEYLVNRTKLAFGDSDTRAMTPMGDIGHKQMADKLNAISKARGNGANHTPESAERIVKWLTTPATMRFLGAQAALGNHTQIVNQIISTGLGSWLKANKILSSKDKTVIADWQEIIDNTGVLNLVNMFQDVMMQGGDLNWNDFGFIPGTILPSHNMVEFTRLLAKGRDAFINNKDKSIDEFILKLTIKAKSRVEREQLKNLKNLNELRKRVNQKELDAKKGELYDILSLDDDVQTEAIVKSQFKKLVGDISDTKLRKMVSWKLSYAFKNKGLESLFTFTGGEELLRKTTIVMALLDAKARGVLGGRDNTPDKELFMSNQAVKIARDAVYNTQFGMTPTYLGEGFNGIGRFIFQYKQYPTLQMIHDYNVMKKFTDSNKGGGSGIVRISKAVGDAVVRGVKQKGRRKGYNPQDPYLDHQALSAARFLFTRGVASVLGSMISVVPYISPLIRWLGAGTFLNMTRSAENAAVGLTLRSIVWVSLMAMGWSDEEEDARDDFLNKIRFTLVPVFLGSLARDIITTKEWIED